MVSSPRLPEITVVDAGMLVFVVVWAMKAPAVLVPVMAVVSWPVVPVEVAAVATLMPKRKSRWWSMGLESVSPHL